MISPRLCKLSLLMLLLVMVDSNSLSDSNQFFALFFFYIWLHRDQPNVDFKMVDSHVHQWKGSSSRYTYN